MDYGSIVKTFSQSDVNAARRYSPPEVVSVRRVPIQGNPVEKLISTSYVEKQNHTLRMHCRRLSRLTNAFSKKAGKLQGGGWVALRLLQFCENSHDDPLHASGGSRR